MASAMGAGIIQSGDYERPTTFTTSAQSQWLPTQGKSFGILPTTVSEPIDPVTHIAMGPSSAGKGILIGMLSAFGSALLIVIIIMLIYLLRNTSRGRILLDRMGRPGEFDDEQAFAKEEAEALEEMDDIQRAEYLRAKGTLKVSDFYAFI